MTLLDVLLGIMVAVIAHHINKWLDSKDKKDSQPHALLGAQKERASGRTRWLFWSVSTTLLVGILQHVLRKSSKGVCARSRYLPFAFNNQISTKFLGCQRGVRGQNGLPKKTAQAQPSLFLTVTQKEARHPPDTLFFSCLWVVRACPDRL